MRGLVCARPPCNRSKDGVPTAAAHPTAQQAALRAAKARRGVRAAALHVAESNAPALALYARLGFAPDATVHEYYGPSCHALRMMRDVGG